MWPSQSFHVQASACHALTTLLSRRIRHDVEDLTASRTTVFHTPSSFMDAYVQALVSNPHFVA